MVDPDFAVLAFFARKLGKTATTDPEYRHYEKTQPSRYSAVNGTINNSATTLAVTAGHGLRFRAGDVIMDVATGEHALVTAVSTDNLTIVRGWGTTAAATMTNADVIVILGSANAEGATIRTALTNVTSRVANYTQIFREPIKETETSMSTEYYAQDGADPMASLRREHLQIHNKDIERSFLFGEPKEDLSGATPIRSTGGAKNYIQTNIKNVATLTEPVFDSFMSDLFLTGGDKKMGLFSPIIVSAINSWAKNTTRLNMYPTDKTFGIAISSYLSAHGTIDFVQERLLAENTTWAGYGFVFDMNLVKYRYLAGNGRNRDTQLLKVPKTNGEDSVIEEYLSEIGFELMLENRHGYFKGITAYT